MSDFYLIAEIKSVYAKNGFVSVISHTDFPERFFELKKVYIELFGDKKEFFIQQVQKVKNGFIVKFCNFNTDKDVEFLIGKKVYVDTENLQPVSENTFFIHDLIGSRVFRNDELFGIIEDVMNLPANDVYIIKNLNNEEVLIPAINDYVLKFDSINKILFLRPGGDIYDNDED